MATQVDKDAAKADLLARVSRVPKYARLHPMIPRLYVPEWKQDMKNRKLILRNADLGGVPHYEHDDALFLEKREQFFYNVEDRMRVAAKVVLPHRNEMLVPPFPHHTSRYWSSLLMRHPSLDQDNPIDRTHCCE